jgi:putative ABC transport system permease protein
MAIPLLAGREFNDRDGATIETAAAIVDEGFARRYWPATNPLGKRIRMTAQSNGRGTWGGMEGLEQWMTVVGVTRDTVHFGLDKALQPGIYVPNKMREGPQMSAAWMYIIVHSAVPSAGLFRSIRAELDKIDPELGMFDPRTMTEVVNRSMLIRRLIATVMTVFAAAALLIATAGLYGVASYNVSRRTREIGIRMAFGATRGDVLGMVVGGGARLVAAGAALGIAGAVVASRAMESMLFGVTPLDAPTYFAVCAVLLGVVAAATVLPARHAAGIEPVRALRSE